MLTAVFIGLIVFSALLVFAQYSLASPALAIARRWTQWVLFSVSLTWAARDLFGDNRPLWLWAATGLLLWPLLQTMYSWFAIKSFSHSPMPLFPRYMLNREGDTWPNQRRFLVLREWVRMRKFQHVQSLKAVLFESLVLRVSVFHDPGARVRLQVMFIPQQSGNVIPCCIFTSFTRTGACLITDNIFSPFGGFYPENWEVERHPWMRSPARLLVRHLLRIRATNADMEPFSSEPLDDLNNQQQLLDRTNTNLGILYPHNLREEHGRLTGEGCYRIWKESWLLDYFGLPRRY